jgi:hypothetical protein
MAKCHLLDKILFFSHGPLLKSQAPVWDAAALGWPRLRDRSGACGFKYNSKNSCTRIPSCDE